MYIVQQGIQGQNYGNFTDNESLENMNAFEFLNANANLEQSLSFNDLQRWLWKCFLVICFSLHLISIRRSLFPKWFYGRL